MCICDFCVVCLCLYITVCGLCVCISVRWLCVAGETVSRLSAPHALMLLLVAPPLTCCLSVCGLYVCLCGLSICVYVFLSVCVWSVCISVCMSVYMSVWSVCVRWLCIAGEASDETESWLNVLHDAAFNAVRSTQNIIACHVSLTHLCHVTQTHRHSDCHRTERCY